MAENRQEVIIAGSGAAGMLAALTLAKAGVPCVVLEKGTSIACSNAARAGGPSLAGTRLQREAGCLVEEEQLFPRLRGRLLGAADRPLVPGDNKTVVLLVPLKEPSPASAEEHPFGFHRVIMEYLQGG